MMKRTIGIIITLLIVFTCITCVSAEDINLDEDTLDLDENLTHIHDSASNVIIKQSTVTASGGTFTQLQSIIDNANNGDTINITGDYTYDAGFTSDGISISKSLTINGNNHTLDGLYSSRVFYISSGDVIINNLTITHGFNDRGGGIYKTGGYLNLNHCYFYMNNKVSSTWGGAMSFWGGNFDILNCTFDSNVIRADGGAFDMKSGSGTIADCTFKNNEANNWGGALENEGATVTIYGCSFFNNTCYSKHGSAVCIYSGSTSIYNCVFLDNTENTIYNAASNNIRDNWWGTNTPDFNTLTGGTTPETWIVMDFTNISSFSTGSVNLLSSLDTIYSNITGNYSKLTNNLLPYRTVSYTTTSGTLSKTNSNIKGNDTNTVNFGTVSYLRIDAQIDNQVLSIGTGDVEISVSVNNDEPVLLETFNYTITVHNNGPDTARNTIVNIKLPNILDYMGCDGNYNNTNGIWTIGDIKPGSTETLKISVKVPYDFTLINNEYWMYANVTGTYVDLNNLNDNTKINITIRNKTGGSYVDLQYLIDKTPENGTLTMVFDVTYDPIYDYSLITGMRLNKTITINAMNHYISGNNTARIFYVTSPNVHLNDMVLTNGTTVSGVYYASYYEGGAILGNGENLTIYNCTFTKNYGGWKSRGSAIMYNSIIYINNSRFYNNTMYMGDSNYYNNGFGTIEANTAYVYNSSFIDNIAKGEAGIWAINGEVHNNIFINNGNTYLLSGSVNCDYNWYGSNTPIFYGGIVPETWIIMNFTNTTPINYNTGTSTLKVSLNTVYNSTTNTYTTLNGDLPTRTVTFNYTHGTVNPQTKNINTITTTTFNHPDYNNMYNWTINATIDNQILTIGGADIGITITPNTNTIDDGKNITYTITVTNNGPMNSTNINATINLPNTGFQIINITTNTGTYNNTTKTWTIGNISSNLNVTLEINGTITDPGPNLIWNATVNYGNQYDYNHTNNTYTTNITINQIADLEIHKNLTQNTTPQTTDNITYTITVTNNGPSTATNITIYDNLSNNLIYINSNPTKGYYNTTNGIWYINNMTPNTNETLNITVTVNKSGFTNNHVNVTSNITDNNLTNNYDNYNFTTPPLSDLWVTINTEPQTSNYITYHIQAGNNGIEPANGTIVTFNHSNLYIYYNHTEDKGLYNNNTGIWDIGYLEVNQTVNLTLIVRLNFPNNISFANVTTKVNITSYSTDLYPENNTDNITQEFELFGNFRLLQDYIDNWLENTTQILPRSFAYDPILDAKWESETYDLINGVRLYKNITITNPYKFTLAGFNQARIFNISTDNIILNGLKFYNGYSPLGGAINIHANNIQILKSTFTNNRLYGDYGGAIFTNGKNTLIQDNTFTQNDASKLGGAIGAVEATNLKIIANIFTNNTVQSDTTTGGAIGIANSTATINFNVFLDNKAVNYDKGHILYIENSNINIEANWYGTNNPDMTTDTLIYVI